MVFFFQKLIFTIILINVSLWSIHSLLAHISHPQYLLNKTMFLRYSKRWISSLMEFSHCLFCAYLASDSNSLPGRKRGNEVKRLNCFYGEVYISQRVATFRKAIDPGTTCTTIHLEKSELLIKYWKQNQILWGCHSILLAETIPILAQLLLSF